MQPADNQSAANQSTNSTTAPTNTKSKGGMVLLTLAASAFLMTLDSSVMNVSMPQVARDTNTTITGVQTAITLFTLVMATMMITGGKIGANIGRKKAFAIGCVIYGAGSFVTAIATSLPVLLIGWSLLEGLGAALIMPATVALVSSNFGPEKRTRAYGLIAASGAIAVAVGPLIGGLATTYFSWRWVFASEVLIVLIILVLSRGIAETTNEKHAPLDCIGSILSAAGLGLAVFGLLKSDDWGWVQPNAGSPSIFGISMTIWLIIAGMFVVWLFISWQHKVIAAGKEPLLQPSMLRNKVLRAGLIMFLFQFLLQAGVFFIVPLFLSVVLELSAIETGIRVLPLSISLLIAAIGIPRIWPHASPRRVIRIGVFLLLVGILVLMSGIDLNANAGVVAIPMFLIGLGIGCASSQLGAVTVSSVPDEQTGEIGGIQNTATNLGASLGTALAGSVLITILSASVVTGIQQNTSVPQQVRDQATVELSSGVPFLSDTQLKAGLEQANTPTDIATEVIALNAQARVDGLNAALALLSIIAVTSLFFTGGISKKAPGTVDQMTSVDSE